ncbi:MAG TPA: DUF2470 domain-containing protein [Actinophytocola sp.]|nr:DUF2470 domain-containing protein [Actinophytocola sp.]
MPSDVPARASVAERARTVLAHAPVTSVEVGGDLVVPVDVLVPDADGSLVLLVDAHGELVDAVTAGPVAATVHAALLSPVPGPDRLLDAVTVHGRIALADDVREALEVVLVANADRSAETVLRPDASALLRMSVAHVRLGDDPVDLDAYARAAPDPLAVASDEVVQHLLHAHPEQVVLLAHLLDDAQLRGVWAVAPERVDRFGLTMRVDSPWGSTRARLDFPAALRGPAELPAAMQELQRRAAQVTTCPFDGTPHGSDR